MALRFKKLTQEATPLVRRTTAAVGVPIAAAHAAVVKSGDKALVKTALSVAVPQGTYARLAPLTPLASDSMIDVGAGVVDADYTGEVGVVLFNHGTKDFQVEPKADIAQLIVETVSMATCAEVSELEDTARGAGGFGSTGVSGAAAASEAASKDSREETLETPAKKRSIEDNSAKKVLRVQRLAEQAVLPKRGSELAAGFDLAAAQPVVVPPGGKAIAKTGLKVAVPDGTYARIAPRSGLAVKRMIHTGAGVVDFDYRGEVGVVLFNYGTEEFAIAAGDRIAQMILQQVDMVAACAWVTELPEESADGPDGRIVRVQKVHDQAELPTRGSEHAAGFDLCAAEATTVPAKGKAAVNIGLEIRVPRGTYGRVAPRSGLAWKKMIHVGGGVVDADHQGELQVVLFNHGGEDFPIAPGDRIAQLVLERAQVLPIEEVASLAETTRGSGGFGSTGVSTDCTTTATSEAKTPIKPSEPKQPSTAMEGKLQGGQVEGAQVAIGGN